MQRIQVEILTHWPEQFPPLQQEWNSLVQKLGSEVGTVFQTYEWNEAWWLSLGIPGHLRLVLIRQDGRLVGILPLHLDLTRTLRVIGSTNRASDYTDLILDPEVPQALSRGLQALTELTDWDTLELSQLPAHSPTRLLLESHSNESGWIPVMTPYADAPHRRLGDPIEDREATKKKSLIRHFNGFAREGKLEFTQTDQAEEALAELDTFFRQHIERRELAQDKSQFLRVEEREYYKKLVETLSRSGILRFATVRFNGEPVAYHLGFEYGGRFIWYKPTFATQYLKKSPGEVLLKFLMEDSIAKKLSEFDFTIGEESFKYRFSNGRRTIIRMNIYRNPWRGRAVRISQRLKRVAKSTLRRSSGTRPSAR